MKYSFRLIKKYPIECGALLLSAALIASPLIPVPERDLSPLPVISMRITDRHDVTLREMLSDQEGRAYWLRPEEVPRQLRNATISAEDGYFYYHPGVNPFATVRALIEDIKAGHFVSGGSTITEQVARNIYHEPRTIPGKIIEAWLSLRLERTISKDRILMEYLNRVPYGNGIYGVGAASLFYFGKPAAHLSIAESAFLAGLPNSPTASNPYKSFNRAKRRQIFVLKRMLMDRYITSEEYDLAVAEPISLQPPDRQLRAPHFTEMVLNSIPEDLRGKISSVRTTLDWNVQEAVEVMLKGHVAALKRSHVTNGAVVVIDNSTCEVIALAGSVDYFDSLRDGQYNGALARRQPGSALKPFVYGLAIEAGMTAADILPDIPFAAPTRSGTFVPQNYDRKYHGPVRLRTALACSYNVPAVRVADRLGLDAVLAKLHDAGLCSLDKSSSFYGLGMALGDGEVTLLELTRAYSMLARGGEYLPDRTILDYRTVDGRVRQFPVPDSSVFAGDTRTVFSPQVAYIITSILSDDDARAPAFGIDSPVSLPFPCAVKTGTSKDYKDNWTVGYTPRWTVGVWAGNFDAKPMRTISGITGAGMLFRDVMLYLEQNERWSGFTIPGGLVKIKVCTRSGKLPTPDCPGRIEEVFIDGTQPAEHCDMHTSYLVDSRTGGRAKRSTPASFVEKRKVEVLPPLYDSWLEQQESERNGRQPLRPVDAPRMAGASSLEDPTSATKIDFGIESPDNGSTFKIDPTLHREFQLLDVAVVAGPGYSCVKLFVDGKFYTDMKDRKIARWALAPGVHSFVIKGEKGRKSVASPTVYIMVN